MAKIAIWAAFYPIIAHIGVQTSKIYLPIIYLVIIGLFLVYSSKIKSWVAKVFLTVLIEFSPGIIAESTFLTGAVPQPTSNAKETTITDIFPNKLNFIFRSLCSLKKCSNRDYN